MIDFKKEMQKRLELRPTSIVAKEFADEIRKKISSIRLRNSKSMFKDLEQCEVYVGEYGVGDRPFGQGCEERIREGKAARAYYFCLAYEHTYYYLDYHYVVEVLEKVFELLSEDKKYVLTCHDFYPVPGNFESYKVLGLVQSLYR